MNNYFNWRRPNWLSVIATVVGVFCLSSLGIWQLQRAEEKKQILAENEIRKSSPPQELTLPINDAANFRFKKITLQGKYLSSKQFLLDNQVMDHQAGYNVLTPFVIQGNDAVVLVDRGWISVGQSRDELPDIKVTEISRSIIGSVYAPYGKPFHLGSIDNGVTTWPRLIQYLDFKELSTLLKLDLLPITVRLDSNQEDGYKTTWPDIAFSPNRHLAYAVQWFALAATLLIIFIVLHISKNK